MLKTSDHKTSNFSPFSSKPFRSISPRSEIHSFNSNFSSSPLQQHLKILNCKKNKSEITCNKENEIDEMFQNLNFNGEDEIITPFINQSGSLINFDVDEEVDENLNNLKVECAIKNSEEEKNLLDDLQLIDIDGFNDSLIFGKPNTQDNRFDVFEWLTQTDQNLVEEKVCKEDANTSNIKSFQNFNKVYNKNNFNSTNNSKYFGENESKNLLLNNLQLSGNQHSQNQQNGFQIKQKIIDSSQQFNEFQNLQNKQKRTELSKNHSRSKTTTDKISLQQYENLKHKVYLLNNNFDSNNNENFLVNCKSDYINNNKINNLNNINGVFNDKNNLIKSEPKLKKKFGFLDYSHDNQCSFGLKMPQHHNNNELETNSDNYNNSNDQNKNKLFNRKQSYTICNNTKTNISKLNKDTFDLGGEEEEMEVNKEKNHYNDYNINEQDLINENDQDEVLKNNHDIYKTYKIKKNNCNFIANKDDNILNNINITEKDSLLPYDQFTNKKNNNKEINEDQMNKSFENIKKQSSFSSSSSLSSSPTASGTVENTVIYNNRMFSKSDEHIIEKNIKIHSNNSETDSNNNLNVNINKNNLLINEKNSNDFQFEIGDEVNKKKQTMNKKGNGGSNYQLSSIHDLQNIAKFQADQLRQTIQTSSSKLKNFSKSSDQLRTLSCSSSPIISLNNNLLINNKDNLISDNNSDKNDENNHNNSSSINKQQYNKQFYRGSCDFTKQNFNISKDKVNNKNNIEDINFNIKSSNNNFLIVTPKKIDTDKQFNISVSSSSLSFNSSLSSSSSSSCSTRMLHQPTNFKTLCIQADNNNNNYNNSKLILKSKLKLPSGNSLDKMKESSLEKFQKKQLQSQVNQAKQANYAQNLDEDGGFSTVNKVSLFSSTPPKPLKVANSTTLTRHSSLKSPGNKPMIQPTLQFLANKQIPSFRSPSQTSSVINNSGLTAKISPKKTTSMNKTMKTPSKLKPPSSPLKYNTPNSINKLDHKTNSPFKSDSDKSNDTNEDYDNQSSCSSISHNKSIINKGRYKNPACSMSSKSSIKNESSSKLPSFKKSRLKPPTRSSALIGQSNFNNKGL